MIWIGATCLSLCSHLTSPHCWHKAHTKEWRITTLLVQIIELQNNGPTTQLVKNLGIRHHHHQHDSDFTQVEWSIYKTNISYLCFLHKILLKNPPKSSFPSRLPGGPGLESSFRGREGGRVVVVLVLGTILEIRSEQILAAKFRQGRCVESCPVTGCFQTWPS